MKIIFKMITNWLRPLRHRAATARNTPDEILRRPLLFLGKDDPWTIGDAFEGTSILGATGSGKTSGSGQAVAKSFLKAGFGGLVLCAKSDEVKLWERYCRDTNRSDSLIIFGPNRPHRFNFWGCPR